MILCYRRDTNSATHMEKLCCLMHMENILRDDIIETFSNSVIFYVQMKSTSTVSDLFY